MLSILLVLYRQKYTPNPPPNLLPPPPGLLPPTNMVCVVSTLLILGNVKLTFRTSAIRKIYSCYLTGHVNYWEFINS